MDRSIVHQKSKGTYKRNTWIRRMVREGVSYATIGRWLHLSRQAIWFISKEKGV